MREYTLSCLSSFTEEFLRLILSRRYGVTTPIDDETKSDLIDLVWRLQEGRGEAISYSMGQKRIEMAETVIDVSGPPWNPDSHRIVGNGWRRKSLNFHPDNIGLEPINSRHLAEIGRSQPDGRYLNSRASEWLSRNARRFPPDWRGKWVYFLGTWYGDTDEDGRDGIFVQVAECDDGNWKIGRQAVGHMAEDLSDGYGAKMRAAVEKDW